MEKEMTLMLTEQEQEFLAKFAEKQFEGAKDNLGTMTPIHVVERWEKEFVADDSGEAWADEYDDYKVYESFEELIEARRENGENLPDYEDVEFEKVDDIWISNRSEYCEAYKIVARSGRFIKYTRPVAFFLIREEAVRYMKGYQAHNCGNCRIYTYSPGYSNQGDFPVFRELLMKMGKALLKGKEEA